jgi:membrane protease YdiL (CAAX protease family)
MAAPTCALIVTGKLDDAPEKSRALCHYFVKYRRRLFMLKNIGKGGVWFAVYFILQNVFSIIFLIAYILMAQYNIPDIANDDMFLEYIMNALMAAIMPSMIASALVFILIYIIHRKVIHQPLYIKSVEWQKVLFFAGFACVLNVITNSILWGVESVMPKEWVSSLSDSVSMATTGQDFWVLLLGTGILIPIMEELTFRYGMHGCIAKSNVVAAYIISSVVFGLMHGNPIQIVYATIFGLILAWVYTKTNNIWYPITIHIVNNTASLMALSFDEVFIYCITFTIIGLALMLTSFILFPNVKAMFGQTET